MVKVFFVLLFLWANCVQLAKAQEEYIITYIEEAPSFSGDLKKFIQNSIVYPPSAKLDSTQGNVFVTFWVDTLGYTQEHKIAKGIRTDLNKEALRVSRLIKFEKPAMQRGKPVKIQYTIPVNFYLNGIPDSLKVKECRE
ncbi:energy transducer TonB [Saccharicrinis aurantiacus]|uniref:energy transducer TonB n=1 Tax=Saccharicrinis aurantiacus TaxID=1849719 RepID=UPI00094F9582|nr:energy transducer TonB [Saccharicrinis aurantiacus]